MLLKSSAIEFRQRSLIWQLENLKVGQNLTDFKMTLCEVGLLYKEIFW